MRYISLFVLISAMFQAQKLQVVDAENGRPLSNARIIANNQILYTNDDGFAPLESTVTNFEVSAAGYTGEKLPSFRNLVRLKPSLREIDEVKIVSVDIRKLLEDVFDHYHKRYFDKPSLYDVVIKSKYFDNNKLHFMAITEAKLWSRSNQYDYRQGYKKNYDHILQLQVNNVKYLKKSSSDSIFRAETDEFRHEKIGSYFLNYELQRTLTNIRSRHSKSSGKLLSEKDGEQDISFTVKTERGTHIKGKIKYHTADKVITFFEADYSMDDLPVKKMISTDGREFGYKYGNAIITYDFYKKDGVYVPALMRRESDNYVMTYNNESHVKRGLQEIIYNTFSKSDKDGIEPRADFNKSIWENVPTKDDKESTILLSKEEQTFVNNL
ncbi:hypothetical protein [Chryseobacterium sp. Leaf394]|uniref:hypothetical protein n=1 Tax=Chryseobacterium sp. Leaf394 TaxID=1736361 RepID=UPI0006FE25D1|nr:hypothetical protein [Chryseobacterium sp. Leaf394]